MVSKAAPRVARLAIGQQRNAAAGQIVTVKLKPLASADVLGKREVITFGAKMAAACAVRKECKLRAVTARHLYQMDLRHVGKARTDEELAFHRVPILYP